MIADLFLSVLEVSIPVSLSAALLILSAAFLNRRYAVKWKYWIWILLAVRLLIPVSDTQLFTGAVTNVQNWSAMKAHNYTRAVLADEEVLPRPGMVTIPARITAPIAGSSEKSGIRVSPLDIAAVLWLAGCFVILMSDLFSYWHYRMQIRKKGAVTKDGSIISMLERLKQELHLTKDVTVWKFCGAASPMMTGFFRPVLILPQVSYTQEEIYFILKHELVHFKRKDVYFKLLFAAAGAVHWFNPLIWMMKKEAAADMELSCDERVVQGTDDAVRRAYTETLLSTLHKHCGTQTAVSAQFYGGKQMMKKRFRNILMKTEKKNGWSVFLCAAVITMGFGMLSGCTFMKESVSSKQNEESDSGAAENAKEKMPGNADEAGQSEKNTDTYGRMAGTWMIDFDVTDPSLWGTGISYGDEMNISETGEFSYYIGIGNGGTGQCEEKDGRVTVEIEPYEDNHSETEILTLNYENKNGSEQILMDWHGENVFWKRADDAKNTQNETGQKDSDQNASGQKETGANESGQNGSGENDAEQKEPGQNEIEKSGSNQKETEQNVTDADTNAVLGEEDVTKIKETVNEFTSAYFSGDTDTIRKFLTDSCGMEVYEGTGSISGIKIKGIDENGPRDYGSGEYGVSVEFSDSRYADMLQYLEILLIKQDDSWKIYFYGLSG